ncbi:MAG TPA: hypothetical protein PLY36_08635 [Spirochaetota bacterium]|nr:hypothetical protein [Spirochaetota bacterium]
MFIRNFFILFLILVSPSVLCRVEAAEGSGLIRIHRGSPVVDLNDILKSNSNILSESDVKRICAEITGRYHERGYTAFYVKKAVLNKDGTVDLFFNEAVVTEIIVTGISGRIDDVAASIFSRGELFNESVLNENISETKKKFNIRQINVSIRRGDGEQIVLRAHAVEKINEIGTEIFNSPVYGVLPEMTYRINYGGFLAGASFSSSFNQEERSCSRGSIYFNTDSIPGNLYFTLSADVTDKKDSLAENGKLIYSHKSLTAKGGFGYNSGPAWIKFFITGTADELKDYPSAEEGFSFSGFQLKLNYDNSLYKIDYDDITAGEIDFSSGWNFIEDRPSSKIVLNYLFNIPLYSGFFFSLNGNSFYTSDKEMFSHVYVYDRFFPCRDDDFSIASWRIVTGADIAYELIKRTVYILPGFKLGMHNADDENNNVYAASMKVLFNTEKVRIELSYLYDVNLNFRDGFFMFSASAVY